MVPGLQMVLIPILLFLGVFIGLYMLMHFLFIVIHQVKETILIESAWLSTSFLILVFSFFEFLALPSSNYVHVFLRFSRHIGSYLQYLIVSN